MGDWLLTALALPDHAEHSRNLPGTVVSPPEVAQFPMPYPLFTALAVQRPATPCQTAPSRAQPNHAAKLFLDTWRIELDPSRPVDLLLQERSACHGIGIVARLLMRQL